MESDGPISGGNLHNGDEKIKFIVHSFLKEYGFLSHVINSINDAYAFGIPTIITKQFPVKEIYYASERRGNREVSLKSKDLEYITFELIAESAEVGKPTREINGKYVPDFPNECKKNDRPYVGPINTTYTLKMSALTKGGSIKEKESVTMTVTPTKLPIVVKSNRCNLEHFSMSELYAVGENPLEDGGVLVNGVNSYAIDCIEKTNPYNAVNTYYEKEHAGIFVHSNVLSKPGIGYENSYETRVILMNTGDIKVVLGFGAFRGVEIPFFIFFRLLNVCSDLDIVKYILSTDDIESLANKQLLNIILRGFQVVEPEYEEFKTLYNPIDIRDKLVNEIFKPDNKLRLREEVLSILDTYLLPHMGDKPEHRHKKLFFLGFMIKKTLMVALDKSLQTNRDALNEKLVQTPGELFSQNFIKDYNKYFIKAVKKRFDDIVHKTPFEDIDLKDAFEVICKNNKLEKKLILSLSSGSVENESTGKKASGNTRYQTQRLYMAPDISLKNACRIIRIAKSSALGKKTRSNVVRETRPSYAGFIDMTQTHDTGDNVGTVKALALTCFITGRGDTHIREILMKDITPESDDLKISDRQGGMVQLNGEIIGYTDNIMDLYNKYHKYKLERKIDRFTGIHCLIHQNLIDFRTGSARTARPLLVVTNNGKKGKDFSQDILYTEQHYLDIIGGKISIDDLVDKGVVEWIDCKEVVNSAYIAQSHVELMERKNDELNPFTHCELLSSFYGVSCATQPFSNHNTDSRTSFQAKVVKQACANPTWERAPMYSNMWRQSINDKQLTKTLVTDFLAPYGKMVRLMIGSYRGHNQEDSLIVNSRLMDRGCYFVVVDDIISVAVEPNEFVTMPEPDITDDIKKANYGKLKGGIVSIGSIVEYGDVIVSKRMANKRENKKKYVDRSYTLDEKHPHLVVNVTYTTNSHGNFYNFHVREFRRLREGDKMSSTHGQKGIISKIYPNHGMPFTSKGVTPDFIMGPHGFPTRKTVGQLLEGVISKLNCLQGVISDHTPFTRVDIEGAIENLKAFNYTADREIMYDGITGQRMEGMMVLVPCYYQRLNKSVYDSHYAVAEANKYIYTRQPVSGHTKHGGIRFGVMEFQAQITTGGCAVNKELHTVNSDAFDTYICRCGSRMTIVNEHEGNYECLECSDPCLVMHKDSFTCNSVINQLGAMGLGIKCGI